MVVEREELARELESQFAAVRTHPGWPDPWPDRNAPQESYSRVTERERWLLGPERGEAWARALVACGLATRADEQEAVRLSPSAEGALLLTLIPRLPAVVEPGRTLSVDIRVGAAEVVALESDCLCDACDSGSADLLNEIDDTMWHVVDGDFVHIDLGGGARIRTTRHGWGANRALGHEESERLIADARAGRCRYPVVSGAPWW